MEWSTLESNVIKMGRRHVHVTRFNRFRRGRFSMKINTVLTRGTQRYKIITFHSSVHCGEYVPSRAEPARILRL